MGDKIMEMLNENAKARILKEEFEEMARESNLPKEVIEEERKTMIMMAMTFVPETITMMGREVYERINE